MIGMNLKYLRKKYGYSQEDLAERLQKVEKEAVQAGYWHLFRLHSLNMPERYSELRQATDFWFSVMRKKV